jgi:hypothetical protein
MPPRPGNRPYPHTTGRTRTVGAVTGSTPHLGNAAAPGFTQTTPPPVAQPQPVDPNFENAKQTASRNIAIAGGESTYQQGNLNFDYGYNADGSINTANPYSRAAMLQLGYENQQRGTTNSLASQGQLYSGALVNQRGIDSSDYARNEAGNRVAYQRGLHAIQAGKLGTYASNSLGVSDADFGSLLKSTYPGT